MGDKNKFTELFYEAEKSYLDGKFHNAEILLLELLDQNPQDSKLNELIGLVYLGQNKNEEAIQSLEIASDGASLFGQYKLAMIYMHEGCYTKAADTLLRLHKSSPQSLEIILELANAYLHASNWGMTLKWLNIAHSLSPRDKKILYNIGRVYDEIHDNSNALKYYKQSLEVDSQFIRPIINMGAIYIGEKNYQVALDFCQRAFQIDPDYDYLIGDIVFCMKNLCMWSQDSYSHALENGINANKKIIFPFQYLSINDSPSDQLRIAKEYSNQYKNFISSPIGDGFKKTVKIRIAYVSADFKSHPMARLMAEIFELHDGSRFEIFAYSLSPLRRGDEMTLRLKKSFDKFYDLSKNTDDEIYDLARKSELTIAVDLMGYTTHARTSLFARRIAPIQINFLGYPGTMGVNFMDYIIADKHLIPMSQREHYSENVIFMPHTFQPYDSKKNISNKLSSRSEAGLPNDKFVFCCFNSIYKINVQIFNIWIEILTAVPNSVLWLSTDSDIAIENLRDFVAKSGLDSSRLIFLKPLAYEDYLESYKFADLFLDTTPFNAGTTARDALFCGLPVLTIEGRSFAARMASSLLRAIDMNELIAKDLSDYRDIAINLATNDESCKAMRLELNIKKGSKPFCPKEYVKSLEGAYEKIRDIALSDGEHGDLYL